MASNMRRPSAVRPEPELLGGDATPDSASAAAAGR